MRISSLLPIFLISFIHPALSQAVMRSTLASGVTISISGNQGIFQSVGQYSPIGAHSNRGFTVRQGFVQTRITIIPQSRLQTIGLDIYPNPFLQNLNVKLEEALKEPYTVQLMNLSGKTIYKETFQPSMEIQLSLPVLPIGEYLLTFSSGQVFLTYKIIKY